LPIAAKQKAANYQRQEFNRYFANTEIIEFMSFHCFPILFCKIDVTKRCKMLEVKKNQHLGCGKPTFPQVFAQASVENF
jgi:hypothetical protein